jgi:predicted RNA-binding protein YlxR (DUF448 family)
MTGSTAGTAARRKKKPVTRRVPERTCVACRTRRPQRHLVSFVRTPDGRVELDRTGKKPGRGAYLCPAQVCWRLARARRSLEQALKAPITPEQWQEFETYMQGLPEQLQEERTAGTANPGR